MNSYDKALDQARKDGASNASFAALRHVMSLDWKVLGSSASGNLGPVQTLEFELTRRQPLSGNKYEIILDEADGMVLTDFRFSILQVTTGLTMEQVEPQYFANPLVFTGSNEAPNLKAIYSARFFIYAAENPLNVKGWPMNDFKRQSSFNQNLQIVADTADVLLPVSAFPEALYGTFPCKPLLRIGGTQKSTVKIILPQPYELGSATSTTEHVAVLESFGAYAPSCSDVYDGMFLVER